MVSKVRRTWQQFHMYCGIHHRSRIWFVIFNRGQQPHRYNFDHNRLTMNHHEEHIFDGDCKDKSIHENAQMKTTMTTSTPMTTARRLTWQRSFQQTVMLKVMETWQEQCWLSYQLNSVSHNSWMAGQWQTRAMYVYGQFGQFIFIAHSILIDHLSCLHRYSASKEDFVVWHKSEKIAGSSSIWYWSCCGGMCLAGWCTWKRSFGPNLLEKVLP